MYYCLLLCEENKKPRGWDRIIAPRRCSCELLRPPKLRHPIVRFSISPMQLCDAERFGMNELNDNKWSFQGIQIGIPRDRAVFQDRVWNGLSPVRRKKIDSVAVISRKTMLDSPKLHFSQS